MAIKFLRKFGEYQKGQICRLDSTTERDYIRHGVAMRIMAADMPEETRSASPTPARTRKKQR